MLVALLGYPICVAWVAKGQNASVWSTKHYKQ